jgi:hypothetical protein
MVTIANRSSPPIFQEVVHLVMRADKVHHQPIFRPYEHHAEGQRCAQLVNLGTQHTHALSGVSMRRSKGFGQIFQRNVNRFRVSRA